MTDTEQNPPPHRLTALRAEDAATVALVGGEAVSTLPKDLYIPPEALEVFLETFEGPLDLLLYLIRRQNLDILAIRVAEITEQYVHYIDLMGAMQLELAGEYLVMAAVLAEIKSRSLLPRPDALEGEEDDPQAELIRRLQVYEQLKQSAEQIAELPRMERDIYPAYGDKPEMIRERVHPEVDMREMLVALAEVLNRAELFDRHAVKLEPLSVRERMSEVLSRIRGKDDFVPFSHLFDAQEGRMGVVVTFLALMELIREMLVEFVQNEPYAPIYVRSVQAQSSESQPEGEAQ